MWEGLRTETLEKQHFRKQASLVAQTIKNLPAMRETQVWSLGWEDPLEEEMATHSSVLTWSPPGDKYMDSTEEPGGLQSVHGVAKSWIRRSNQHTHRHIQRCNTQRRLERNDQRGKRKLKRKGCHRSRGSKGLLRREWPPYKYLSNNRWDYSSLELVLLKFRTLTTG